MYLKFFQGIINLFPSNIKMIMMPKEGEVTNNNSQISKNVDLKSDESELASTKEENDFINEKIYNINANEQLAADKIQIKLKVHTAKSKNSSSAASIVNKFKFKPNNILIENKLINANQEFFDFFEKEFPLKNEQINSPTNCLNKISGGLEKCNQVAEFNRIEDEAEYKYYEIEDGVVIKTVVLESSDRQNKRISIKADSETSMKDLQEFCWDNIHEYYHIESKKAKKGDKEGSTNFIQLLTNRIQQQLISKINYNKLSKGFVIFLVTFIIQMIISKRARRWSVSFIQFAVFLATSLGAGGTLYFLLQKKK